MRPEMFFSRAAGYTGTLLVLAGFAIWGHTALAKPNVVPEIQETREEISLLNLLRGLYLSRSQVDQLARLAIEAQGHRNTLEDAVLRSRDSYRIVFENLRDKLYESPGKEKMAQDTASQLDHQFKEALGEMDDKIAALEDQARALLSGAQISVVEGFKPCLIPPKDLRNPVRVGQADGEPGIIGKLADLIHCTPDGLWRERGKQLLERVSQEMESEAGALNTAMKSDILSRLKTVADSIRACPDVDYSLKRQTFASELLLIDPRKALKKGHRKVGQIGHWLLSDAAARVLPKWSEKMTATAAPGGALDEDCIDSDGPETGELGNRVRNQLRRLFRERRGGMRLGTFEKFVENVDRATKNNDRKALSDSVLACLEKLAELEVTPLLVKAFGQAARGIARMSNLPVLAPKYDPFGFNQELQAAMDAPDDPKSLDRIRSVINHIRAFKPL